MLSGVGAAAGCPNEKGVAGLEFDGFEALNAGCSFAASRVRLKQKDGGVLEPKANVGGFGSCGPFVPGLI